MIYRRDLKCSCCLLFLLLLFAFFKLDCKKSGNQIFMVGVFTDEKELKWSINVYVFWLQKDVHKNNT